METTGIRRSFPDAILVEIIARLPLRSIARFKSVCKEWRSLIESSYFRSLFVSLHKNLSSSWSLMFPMEYRTPITEAIGFYGCERWDLPKSPASYLLPFQLYPNHPALDYHYVDSSHGLVWIEVGFGLDDIYRIPKYKSFVGNPVLQEWVEIPSSPYYVSRPTGLVTRVENGVVSSFKMIRTSYDLIDHTESAYVWRRVYVYSSETGAWTLKKLRPSYPFESGTVNRSLNLDGMLYVWEKRLDDAAGPGVIVSLDFYGEEDEDEECRIIPLPGQYNKYVRRCLTTSCGHVIYVEILYRRLKVWKLKNSNNSDGEWWQLTREEIDMASVGFDVLCFPLGMNPFDSDLFYLWSRQHSCLVSGNLRTQEFTLHKESETWSDGEGCWRVNSSDSKKHIKRTCENVTDSFITLSQFVLPQWMDPVPRPPN